MFLIVKKFGIQNTSFKRLKTREIFNRLQSEDLPHESGIKTTTAQPKNVLYMSEDLPHESGIKTIAGNALPTSPYVGRLAPRIGD